MSSPILVYCTVASMDEAQSIAGEIVKQRLVACCNIVPNIHSVYIWKGEVVRDNEILLLMKTTSEKYKMLEKKIIALHSYEIPEIISTEIQSANAKYLEWIKKTVEV